MKLRTLLATLCLTAACGPIPTPPVPVPPVPHSPIAYCAAPSVHDGTGAPLQGAAVTIGGLHGTTNKDGYLYLEPVPGGVQTLDIALEGYTCAGCGDYQIDSWHCDIPVTMTQNAPPFPAPPTRDQVLNLCLSFQGLNVVTSFGNEPYFEASLAWHDQLADREAIYAAKHNSQNAFCPTGDTHALIFVPFGKPLYDEPNQFYTADKFPALDWTNNNTSMDPKFVALVEEVIEHGFIPLIVGAEDYSWVDDGKWDAQASLIVHALQTAPAGDLTRYSSVMPGFDGVFYGAANDQVTIPRWASNIRSYCPLCYIVIEHQTGHLPLGEGPSDWVVGARMQVYDALYSEYNDDQFDDTVWQIDARTRGRVALGGTYIRPPDQPADDDTTAPWYLADFNPRGKIYACPFEFGLYDWVRRHYNAAHVFGQRLYFIRIGATCGG